MAPPSKEWPKLWRFDAERVQEGGKVVFRRKGDDAQLFSGGRRVKDLPLHGSGLGSSMRALSLTDSAALRDLFFTLSDAVIYDPKTPALRGLSAGEPLDPIGLDGSGLAPALKTLQTPDGGLGPLAREQVLALIDWASGIEIGRLDLDVVSPSVWSALDRKSQRRVAIKVLHPEQAREPSRRERFFRGARMMANLGHEAVVRVLDPKGVDGGYFYFVMEFAPGGDLYRAVVKGRVPRERVAPILLRIGEALTEAHGKGIVHRDVKPANIVLDAEGQPLLTDFDLAVADDTTGGTRTGAAMGSYLFMAPEQSRDAKRADARADVYSLGMTVLFCLHGADLPEITMRRPDKVIEALSCSPAMKQLVTRAIELAPEERFADARAFCEALQAAAAEHPAPPLASSPTELEAVHDWQGLAEELEKRVRGGSL